MPWELAAGLVVGLAAASFRHWRALRQERRRLVEYHRRAEAYGQVFVQLRLLAAELEHRGLATVQYDSHGAPWQIRFRESRPGDGPRPSEARARGVSPPPQELVVA